MEQNTNLGPRYLIRLRDLRGWHLLTVACGSCRHKAHLRLWQLTDRRSPDEFLVDVERKLRTPLVGIDLSRPDPNPDDPDGSAGVFLRCVDLPDALLAHAKLKRASLEGSNLFRADLHANAEEKDGLNGAKLNNADLRCSNLWQVDLRNADLRGALLDDALLSGADLINAKIAQEQLDVACGDLGTLLPKNLHRPSSWKPPSDETGQDPPRDKTECSGGPEAKQCEALDADWMSETRPNRNATQCTRSRP
ncbi:pentapeptide repeat-containing protein [Geminicoccus roseus]|uniref:pentapeptide repeat-containing protein n=1 Tax=Geminicoccus roseus TaxID=404900 RepID=UPI0009FD4D77|nr:pentapeptide repeat-containing protein [Geminicoccus roseus]